MALARFLVTAIRRPVSLPGGATAAPGDFVFREPDSVEHLVRAGELTASPDPTPAKSKQENS